MKVVRKKLGVENLVGCVVGVDQDEIVENLLGMMLACRHGLGTPGDHVVLVRRHRVLQCVERVDGRGHVGLLAQEHVQQHVQDGSVHLVWRFSSQSRHQGADIGVKNGAGRGWCQLYQVGHKGVDQSR